MSEPGIRFTDVLTNASTIASLKGDQLVGFGHLADAIEVLTGAKSMEEFGPGVSPLLRQGRHEGGQAGMVEEPGGGAPKRPVSSRVMASR